MYLICVIQDVKIQELSATENLLKEQINSLKSIVQKHEDDLNKQKETYDANEKSLKEMVELLKNKVKSQEAEMKILEKTVTDVNTTVTAWNNGAAIGKHNEHS